MMMRGWYQQWMKDNQISVLIVVTSPGNKPLNCKFSCTIEVFFLMIFFRKRGRAEHEAESRVSEESTEVPSDGSKPILPGLLEVDEGLWDHIQHVQTVIKLLPSARDQVEELAKYDPLAHLYSNFISLQICCWPSWGTSGKKWVYLL